LSVRFRVGGEVGASLREGRPAVALETAVLTHGLPRPDNASVYRDMMDAVRAEGAVPVPVGVWQGAIWAGLPEEALEALAGPGAAKVGLADLPAVVARGGDGGATVAVTLWAASRAGVRVFATGGIGGVHRGWQRTLDVSGDLVALARFGGCVVCSGAKAVLDLGCTLELLETAGVCVVGYRTDRFPAFLWEDSGLGVRHRVDTPEEVAEVLRCRDALGLEGAVLVANPPPEGLSAEDVERVVGTASQGWAPGPDATPRLLAEAARRTAGRSVRVNRALLVENARLGARIARALCPG